MFQPVALLIHPQSANRSITQVGPFTSEYIKFTLYGVGSATVHVVLRVHRTFSQSRVVIVNGKAQAEL